MVLNNSFGALTQLKLSAYLNSECKANEVERRGSENTKRLNYYISSQIGDTMYTVIVEVAFINENVLFN